MNKNKVFTLLANDIPFEPNYNLIKEHVTINGYLITDEEMFLYYDSKNNELSYERALALVNYWKSKGILFYSYKDGFKVKDNLPFELIVSGSGISSEFREVNEPDNQRFVIHVIPKPGLLN